MKIILDTNVLIDAMQDNYAITWRIIDLILSDKILAFASSKIINEYNLIIRRNVVREPDKEKLEKFISKTNIVEPKKRIKIILDDPEDDKFIECADECGADYIISSDRHLLLLEKYNSTKILDPADFWHKFSNENSDEQEWKNVFKNMLGI
jgi:putative PIN family toxin of toxin-antitoxin system